MSTPASRSNRVMISIWIVGLLVIGAVATAAPGPDLVSGQVQLTDAGVSGDGANLTTIYSENITVGSRLWLGNASASYIESTTAGRVDTNASWNSTRAASTDLIHIGRVSGDNTPRITTDAAGLISWGPGNAAADANLYRGAANSLKTDNEFTAVGRIVAGSSLPYSGSATLDLSVGDGVGSSEIALVSGVSDHSAILFTDGIGATTRGRIIYNNPADTITFQTAGSSDRLTIGIGYLDIANAGTIGTCNSDARGQIKLVEGAGGVADTLSMCMKSAGDTYSWKTVATG